MTIPSGLSTKPQNVRATPPGTRPAAAKKPAKASAARKAETAAPPASRTSGRDVQAKHLQAANMVRDLEIRAEALSANADRLLDRLS